MVAGAEVRQNRIADDRHSDRRPQPSHSVQLLPASPHASVHVEHLHRNHEFGYRFQGPPTGPLRDNTGSAVHEDLGKQLVAGAETTGTRDSITYNPGVFGNDQAMTVAREFWYSAELGINLLSKLSDPRIGTQTFTATDLIPAEPDAALFKLPQGFKVVDQRG